MIRVRGRFSKRDGRVLIRSPLIPTFSPRAGRRRRGASLTMSRE
jgi:hypothetical protein